MESHSISIANIIMWWHIIPSSISPLSALPCLLFPFLISHFTMSLLNLPPPSLPPFALQEQMKFLFRTSETRWKNSRWKGDIRKPNRTLPFLLSKNGMSSATIYDCFCNIPFTHWTYPPPSFKRAVEVAQLFFNFRFYIRLQVTRTSLNYLHL